MDFLTELQRIESCEKIPLELHWLTMNSVQGPVYRWTFEPL